MTTTPNATPGRPTARRRALIIGLAAAALAAPALAATISLLKPPQEAQTERIHTDKGTVTVIYRPTVSDRELGFKRYRGAVTEQYLYEVRDPRGRPSHRVAGMEVVVADPLSRIKAYFLKALPGAKARAVGDRKVGKYIITRDKGDEAIVIEAVRPAGKSSTIRMRRVIQGKLDVTPGPTPYGGVVE
jgi:hypothetical protein